jgi:hypothetical protein
MHRYRFIESSESTECMQNRVKDSPWLNNTPTSLTNKNFLFVPPSARLHRWFSRHRWLPLQAFPKRPASQKYLCLNQPHVAYFQTTSWRLARTCLYVNGCSWKYISATVWESYGDGWWIGFRKSWPWADSRVVRIAARCTRHAQVQRSKRVSEQQPEWKYVNLQLFPHSVLWKRLWSLWPS